MSTSIVVQNPSMTAGTTVVVTDKKYGAVADNVTNNVAAFQAAHDDLAASLIKAGGNCAGVLLIPSSFNSYWCRGTVMIDHPNISVKGEGWGTLVVGDGNAGAPIFAFGIPRDARGQTLQKENYPDLWGVLDSYAVPSANTRRGLRTCGNSFAQFQACSLSSGVTMKGVPRSYVDLWNSVDQATIEVAVLIHGAVERPSSPASASRMSLGPNTPLIGFGRVSDDPGPFSMMCWDKADEILVMFRTSDMEAGANRPSKHFKFSVAGFDQLLKIAVQFDLRNNAYDVFVNGRSVPLTEMEVGNTKNLTFMKNEHYPLMFAMNDLAGHYDKSTCDVTLAGLHFSKGLRYRAGDNGQQLKIDGGVLPDDFFRYFHDDGNTIGFLPLTDDHTGGRCITVQNGGASAPGLSSGWFLSTNLLPIGNNGLHDIALQGANTFGQTVCLGAAENFKMSNVQVNGGFNAVGNLNFFANYSTRMRSCELSAYDVCYYSYEQTTFATDIDFPKIGRWAVRSYGSGDTWDGFYVYHGCPITEGLFKGTAGGTGGTRILSNGVCDFEGEEMSVAAFYYEAHASVPCTVHSLEHIYLGTLGANTPILMLKDIKKEEHELRPCRAYVKDVQAYGEYSAVLDMDGPLWYVSVDAIALTGKKVNARKRWGDQVNVKFEDFSSFNYVVK